MDFTCHSQKPAISSLASVNGPSMTVRWLPEKRTRLPFDEGCTPSPASITPALTSCSLYFPIASRILRSGMTPASESLFAFTITITRMDLLLVTPAPAVVSGPQSDVERRGAGSTRGRENRRGCGRRSGGRGPSAAPGAARRGIVAAPSLGADDRRVDDVLGHEPDLQLVGTDHVADDQIVGPLIVAFGRQPRHRPRLLQDDLVRVEQPR